MANAIVSPLWVVKARTIPVSVKVVDSNARVLRFAISDERRDRDGDIVRQRGMDLRNYRPNPLVYWAHQGDYVRAPDQLPIAKTVAIERGDVKGLATSFADKLFVPAEVGYELSRLTYDLASLGFINCCSIGFMRRKYKPLPKDALTPDELKTLEAGGFVPGLDLVATELYESSLVGIPSNVGATAQRGFDPNPDWDVDRVREVARKHLEGAALDRFIRDLTGVESIEVGSSPIEKAPEAFRSLLLKSAANADDVDDPGFDDYALHVGKARPAPATTKAPDPEPEPTDDEPPVAPIATTKATTEKLTDAEAGAMESRLGMLAGSLGALIARAESVVAMVGSATDALTAACDRMTACCAAMEAADTEDAAEPADGAQPMTMASFAAEIRAELKALAVRVEDSHAEFYLAHLNSKSNTAPRDTRSDPAPRVEAAKSPAAVAVKQPPAVDLSALAPQIAKALGAEVAKQVEAGLYKARGGVEIP